jgi:oxygen-independent coproporphyrinogen III oxidase
VVSGLKGRKPPWFNKSFLTKIKARVLRDVYLIGMHDHLKLMGLLESYGGAVPRYTSYPSAAQFKGNFKYTLSEKYPKSRDASVYVHIPFCRSLCSYCGCMTKVVRHDSPIIEYLVSLEDEISLLGSETAYNVNAGHVHFGGGSPNLLDGTSIAELIDLIDIHFNIRNNAEIAIEADPRQMTRQKAFDYASAGVNRVSLGVQDFQKDTQVAINRLQPFEMIETCVTWLRDAGIKSINFDLMYGLPYQTVASVSENVRQAVTLKPDRIAVFGYAHVPWMRPHQKLLERHPLPGAWDRYRQSEAVRAAFMGNGYHAIGMDHYALPHDSLATAAATGKLRRNFQGYTTDNFDDLIGIGLSSISRFPDALVQNTTSFKEYKERLNQGTLPVEKGCDLSAEDKMRSEVIERLMCYLSVDLSEVCLKHGFDTDFLAKEAESMLPMINDGLVNVAGFFVRVTETGRPFIRSISSKFDSHFQDTKCRHARAV